MDVRLTPQAQADIRQIAEYLNENVPEYRDFVVNGLLLRIEKLGFFPHRGKPIPEFIGKTDYDLREIQANPYCISYCVHPDEVVILAVQHQSRKRKLPHEYPPIS
jgi:plasmid stabilization system protein ParE